MIVKVLQNPAPDIDSSDLTGRKLKRRRTKMAVAFRRKRKRSRRRAKGRTRRTVRRANPKRKIRRKRARRKTTVGKHRPRLTYKSGKWYGGKSPRSLIKRGSGTRVNARRKRRRVRRNPNGLRGVRRMFTRRMLIDTAKAGTGIAIGFATMPVFYRILPQRMKANRRWLGGIHVALGLGIAGLVRNRDVKDVGLVIAATGVYDLIAMNVEFLGLPPLRTTSELADRLIPRRTPTPAETASGCYGGQLDMSHYGASYPVSAAPVSPVAATGVGASYERVGASYPSMAYPTIGLSGEGGADLDMDDLVN
jgi:hypothetical protein